MTDALTGFGSEFWLENAAGTLVEMGELIELDPGAEEWGTAEVTHFKSPGKRREYLTTLIEGGKGSYALNWVPGSPTDLVVTEAHQAGEARAYKMVVPTAGDGTWEISGSVLVLSRTPTVPLDDRMTCNVSLQFTGARDEEAGA